MRILAFDELPRARDADRALVHLAAFGGFFTRGQIEKVRNGSGQLADYVGLFGVERGQIVGQVFVLRLPYRFAGGEETIAGIAAVGTRPDRARTGVARTLLTQVHERERQAGIRYSTLWTNRSWGAHRLYEQLGYRDVYFPPWAVRRPASHGALPSRTIRVRAGRKADLDAIDALHDRVLSERLGFATRVHGYSRTEARLGSLDPVRSLLVVGGRGRLDGYAIVDRTPGRVTCGELVASGPRVRAALVGGVERLERRAGVAFQNTVVSEPGNPFARSDYARLSTTWYGLMAAPLRGDWSAGAAIRQFATTDPRFVCMAGDRF